MIFVGKEAIDITEELYKLYRKEPPSSKQRIVLRTAIMGYELGDIQQFAVRNTQERLPDEVKKAYEENAKLGMADLITQCLMLCFDLGWSSHEILLLGLKHLKERHKDFEQYGFGEDDS